MEESRATLKFVFEGRGKMDKDAYPDLPAVIDVGGDLYDLGAAETVNLSHKSRETFHRTFHRGTYGSLPVEYLLRKYMPVGAGWPVFTSSAEREQFLDVLKRRIEQLRASQQFGSDVIKNIPIRRWYQNLVEWMAKIKAEGAVKKRRVPVLSENEIFQLLLEMAWYLAHPSEVPATMESEWRIVLERLKEGRLSDVLDTIRAAESVAAGETKPLQYFRRLDMDRVVEAETREAAMDRVREMATAAHPVNAAPIRPEMSRRLRDLLQVLELKKYVEAGDPERLTNQNVARVKRSMMSNPMGATAADSDAKEETKGAETKGAETKGEETKGEPDEVKESKKGQRERQQKGGSDMLSLPLGEAMMPVFDYLRVLFDPLYSILEQAAAPSVKRAIVPDLLLLLHLCNEFHAPAVRTMTQKMEYGMYRIRGAPPALVDFLREQLREIQSHVGGLPTDEARVVFERQLFALPRVRLRSLIRNNGGVPTAANASLTVFQLSFFVVGANLAVDAAAEGLEKAFEEGSVWLAFSDSIGSKVPFRLWEIDYSALDVRKTGVNVTPLPSLPSLPPSEMTMDEVLRITPHVVYTDAQLALSTLIALKERMPR